MLPVFQDVPLEDIDIQAVDRFAQAKRAEGKLSNRSINKVIQHMAACLELAVEYGRIPSNPAKGRKRRLPTDPPKRTHMEPEQLPALLDACKPNLRYLVATLAGCGLRIGEATALTWGDVNLPAGTLAVKAAKTHAGVRTVDIPTALVEELVFYKARRKPRPSDPVFLNVTGSAPMKTRTAEMALRTAVKAANRKLEARGIEQIPAGLTPHALRRLYASLRFGAGEDGVYISEQLGHTSPQFSMSVYAKAIRRRARLTGAYALEFDQAMEWAHLGVNAQESKSADPAIPHPERPAAASVD